MTPISDNFNAFGVEDIPDEHGGIVKVITGTDLTNDTVAPGNLLLGFTAHDATGRQIVGTMPDSGGSAGHCVCFNVIFDEDDTFEVKMDEDDCFCVDFGEFAGGEEHYDIYEGSYEVIPNTYVQILETDAKLMADDVTVYAVPYAEVSNPEGGYTVTIGL